MPAKPPPTMLNNVVRRAVEMREVMVERLIEFDPLGRERVDRRTVRHLMRKVRDEGDSEALNALLGMAKATGHSPNEYPACDLCNEADFVMNESQPASLLGPSGMGSPGM